MKKRIASFISPGVLCICLFFSAFSGFSQTVIVTIGTDTTTNLNTQYPAPYGNWYWGAKHQFIIRPSEFAAAGMGAGLIYSIAFDVAVLQGTPLLDFTIKLKNTPSAATTTNFDNTGLTTVWGPQTYTDATGWNVHTFSTPFLWDGSSNLLIETCFNNTSYTINAETYYSTTTFNSSIYYRADAAGVCSNPTGTTSMNRPNMRFEGSPPPPFDAGISAISSPNSGCMLTNSETITAGVGNFGTDTVFNIDVYYSINGGPPVPETINDTILPGNVLTYSFLTPADLSLTGVYTIDAWTQLTGDSVPVNDSLTNYQVEHLTPITVFPFKEDFETEPLCPSACGSACQLTGNWTNALNDDIDWTVDEGGTPNSPSTGPGIDNTTKTNTGNYLYTEASGACYPFAEAMLLSPCIDISTLNITLSFAYHLFGSAMGNLYIDIYSGGIWTSIDSITGQQQSSQTAPWMMSFVDLSSFSGIIRIRFRGVTGSGFTSDMAIDDIMVYEKPLNDAGVIAISSPVNSGCNLTSSETITVDVKNFGADTAFNIDAYYRINGGTSVLETINDTILPGNVLTYSFLTPADLSLTGVYIIDVWTKLTGDTVTVNDSLTNYSVENTSTVADFTVDNIQNCTGGINNFTDLSTNSPSAWKWEFGDGGNSTLQNPSYSYLNPGSYTITLIATNACNADTLVKTGYIQITEGPGMPACTPTVINELNDIGIYNVSFNTINNTTGSLIESYKDYSCFYFTTVIIGSKQTLSVQTGPEWSENVRAWIDYNNDSIFNDTAELVFASNNRVQTHNTEFIIPQNAVTDTMLRMRVSSDYYGSPPPAPCSQLTYGQAEDYGIIIQPNTSFPTEADFTYTFIDECQGIVEFNDYSSYFPSGWSWDFGDGNSDSASPQVTNTYPSSGIYIVTLISTNAFGSDTVAKSINIRSVKADFTISDTVYSGINATFTDNSIGANSWFWKFGLSDTSNIQNPQHIFNATGFYTVWLYATNTNSGCVDSMSKPVIVLNAPVGIKVNENDEMISIVPIPSSGILYINYDVNGKREINISIYNILEQQIFYDEISVNRQFQQKIDLSEKPKGIYFVKIAKFADNEMQVVRKIVLE